MEIKMLKKFDAVYKAFQVWIILLMQRMTLVCKQFWGRIVSWAQKLKHKKFAGWILSAISVTVLIGIGIAVNRYFLYTAGTSDGSNCLEQLNLLKILFLVNSPENIACIKQSGFWQRLSELDEPLNIRNMLLSFAGVVGLGLAGWRSWVGERQTRATEERRVEERRAEQRNEERRLDERFADAVKSLAQGLNETSYPAHLGAIVALRDLAIDNNNYTQRCLDILCSCNQWMEEYLGKFSCNEYTTCFANRRLTDSNRIVPTKSDQENLIKLEHERRSQQSLNSVATILDKISKKDNKIYGIRNIDLSGKTLCGINLSNSKIAGINLENAYLNGASFEDANLRKAKLYKAQLRGAYMIGAQMQNVNITSAQLQGANLMFAQMQQANLSHANLQRANLINVNLQVSVLRFAQLQGADCKEVKMQGSYCHNVQLQGADLSEAQMQGTDLCNAQMQGANMTATNFQGADLTRADISGSRLLESNLYGVTITGTKFVNVMFDEISNQGHIKEQDEREEFINDIRDNFHFAFQEKAFIKRIKDAWDKTDNEVIPEGLDALHQASILKQDSEGSWIIIPSKIRGLKAFYRELVTKIYLKTGILESRIAYLINNASKYPVHIEDDYSKIEASLVKIWKGLEREFLEKEE